MLANSGNEMGSYGRLGDGEAGSYTTIRSREGLEGTVTASTYFFRYQSTEDVDRKHYIWSARSFHPWF
jgi:hypothetical protein